MKTKAEYEKDYGSKELRKMCSSRNLGTSGGKADFAKRLADDDRKNAASTHEVRETIVRKPSVKAAPTKAVTTIPVSGGFAVVEQATVKASVKARITDASKLDGLLETMFPGMTVVSVDGIIDLTAELKLGTVVAPAPVKEEPVVDITPEPVKEKPVVKKKVVAKGIKKAPAKTESPKTEAEMKKEADAMAKSFNF